MKAPFQLLRHVGQALLTSLKVANPLLGGLVDLLPEVAEEVWQLWRKDTTDKERRDELQALAQVAAGELAREVARILREIAPGQPAELRDKVGAYLLQVPGAVQRSLRRGTDPSGRTVPTGLRLRRSEDLRAFLPERLPRFKRGDRPIPGVKWELEELLGVGGFGEVWKARNPDFAGVPPVALKFCLDEQASAQLVREARVVGQVLQQHSHPGIVQLRNVHVDPVCLEYEFVPGGDLGALVRDWHQSGRGPTPVQATAVVLQLARTMAFAHAKGIVHRDLKPANILVQTAADGRSQFKIADFGIGATMTATSVRDKTRRATGTATGEAWRSAYTLLYASPQQMAGDDPDPRDDVFSLGIIWYQLLSGNLGGGRPGGLRWQTDLVNRGVSESLLGLLGSCFEDAPEDRPRDAHDLAGLLEAWLRIPEAAPAAGKEPRRRQPPPLPPIREERPRSRTNADSVPTPSSASRRKRLFRLLVLAGVLLATGVAWALRSPEKPTVEGTKPGVKELTVVKDPTPLPREPPFLGVWRSTTGPVTLQYEFRRDRTLAFQRTVAFNGKKPVVWRADGSFTWDGKQGLAATLINEDFEGIKVPITFETAGDELHLIRGAFRRIYQVSAALPPPPPPPPGGPAR